MIWYWSSQFRRVVSFGLNNFWQMGYENASDSTFPVPVARSRHSCGENRPVCRLLFWNYPRSVHRRNFSRMGCRYLWSSWYRGRRVSQVPVTVSGLGALAGKEVISVALGTVQSSQSVQMAAWPVGEATERGSWESIVTRKQQHPGICISEGKFDWENSSCSRCGRVSLPRSFLRWHACLLG